LPLAVRLPQNRRSRLVPPPGFQLVAEIDLSSRSYEAETLGQFSLDETAVTGIFFTIQDINTTYFDLNLIGQTVTAW